MRTYQGPCSAQRLRHVGSAEISLLDGIRVDIGVTVDALVPVRMEENADVETATNYKCLRYKK